MALRKAFFESETKKQLKGNIYLAKVTRVEFMPSLLRMMDAEVSRLAGNEEAARRAEAEAQKLIQ